MREDFRSEFLRFAIDERVLRFGSFVTKAGRNSPYFFNAGLFDRGASLGKLGDFYARALLASELEVDMVFGPAYKGIPLAAALVVALAARGRDLPFAFNRKEVKDHGEGGTLVGAPLAGRVLIVDDVVSAGTSIRGSAKIIRDAGAVPAGALIALDRRERGLGEISAVEEVEKECGFPVAAIATLDDLLALLEGDPDLKERFEDVLAYRERYGV